MEVNNEAENAVEVIGNIYDNPELLEKEDRAMKKYTQADFDSFKIDEYGSKICPAGDDAKWTDGVGGIHEDGCGWAPNGDFCGECSNKTCENCFVWNRKVNVEQ